MTGISADVGHALGAIIVLSLVLLIGWSFKGGAFLISLLLVFTYVGRKIGWVLYRLTLDHPVASGAMSAIWSLISALAVTYLRVRFHPNVLLMALFYAAGAYVSILNYGIRYPAYFEPKKNLNSSTVQLACLVAYLFYTFMLRGMS